MKAAILSVAAFFYFSACFPAHAHASNCVAKKARAYVVSRCDNDRLWIIETTRPLVAYFATPPVPTLREKASASPAFSLLLNGGYHDGNYANAKPEGLLIIDGKLLSTLKPNDGQLTHVLSMTRDGRISAIREAVRGVGAHTSDGNTHVQSGPLIVEDGRIAMSSIDGSLNGKGAYKRTAIGRTREGETVIVIAKTPRTLDDLAKMVLRVNEFEKRGLSLLNLDGGPSTAIHTNATNALSYGADKVTPLGFALR
jgi:exopolysaccharide biosynthesis protein